VYQVDSITLAAALLILSLQSHGAFSFCTDEHASAEVLWPTMLFEELSRVLFYVWSVDYRGWSRLVSSEKGVLHCLQYC